MSHWVVTEWMGGANRHAGAISFMSVRAWLCSTYCHCIWQTLAAIFCWRSGFAGWA